MVCNNIVVCFFLSIGVPCFNLNIMEQVWDAIKDANPELSAAMKQGQLLRTRQALL